MSVHLYYKTVGPILLQRVKLRCHNYFPNSEWGTFGGRVCPHGFKPYFSSVFIKEGPTCQLKDEKSSGWNTLKKTLCRLNNLTQMVVLRYRLSGTHFKNHCVDWTTLPKWLCWEIACLEHTLKTLCRLSNLTQKWFVLRYRLSGTHFKNTV